MFTVVGEPDTRPRVMLNSGETKFRALIATGSADSFMRSSTFKKMGLELQPTSRTSNYIPDTPLGKVVAKIHVGTKSTFHEFLIMGDDKCPDDALIGMDFIMKFGDFGFHKNHVTFGDCKVYLEKMF